MFLKLRIFKPVLSISMILYIRKLNTVANYNNTQKKSWIKNLGFLLRQRSHDVSKKLAYGHILKQQNWLESSFKSKNGPNKDLTRPRFFLYHFLTAKKKHETILFINAQSCIMSEEFHKLDKFLMFNILIR